MQCPPIPGPGKNGIKPNGLVPAASTTSQIFTPILSQSWANSFTKAILTLRKMFSNSFSISATFGDETGITLLTINPWAAHAKVVHHFVTPPATIGVFPVCHVVLPGSILSGENAKKKSLPMINPFFSNIGCTYLVVVPGNVVLFNMINCPKRNESATASED